MALRWTWMLNFLIYDTQSFQKYSIKEYALNDKWILTMVRGIFLIKDFWKLWSFYMGGCQNYGPFLGV